MMQNKWFNTASFLAIFALLSSCFLQNKDNKIIDVSEVNVSIDFERFEQDFFQVDTNDLYESLHIVRNKDTSFFDFYTIQMMRFGKISDTLTKPTMLDIKAFLSNPYLLGLYDTVNERFPNTQILESELTEAFKHYKYYFPNNYIPKIRTVISEFGYNVAALDTDYIAICLDMYLGKNYVYYRSFDFPQYVVNRFEQKYIVPNSMEVIYNTYFAPDALAETDALIYAMIEKGKKLYFLECMQPEKEKYVLIGFSKNQFEWCQHEEGEIWRFYNENDLFYNKNYMDHKRHVEDGPLTAGMPAEAPGNVGSWVGWQIVNQYMENADGKVSLPQLLETSAKDILAKSNYKPK